MSTRRTLAVCAVVLLSSVVAGSFFGQRSSAQTNKADPSAVGRYQVIHGKASETTFLLVDTATGHCWTNRTTGSEKDWTDLGTPNR